MFEHEKLSHIIAVALLIIAVSTIAVAEYFGLPADKILTDRHVFCTQEAKLCPDGSVVGPTGPNCEFAECSKLSFEQINTSTWKTYHNEKYGFEFRYPENSRYEEVNKILVLSFKTADGRDIYFMLGASGINQKIPRTIEDIKAQYSEKSSRYVTIGSNQWLERMDGGCEGGECGIDFFYYHDKLLRNDIGIWVSIPVTIEESNYDPRQYLGEELRIVEQILSTFKFIDTSQNSGCEPEPPASCAAGYKLSCVDGKWGCR